MTVEIDPDKKQQMRARLERMGEILGDLEYELSWWEVNAKRADELAKRLSGEAQQMQNDTVREYVKEEKA